MKALILIAVLLLTGCEQKCTKGDIEPAEFNNYVVYFEREKQGSKVQHYDIICWWGDDTGWDFAEWENLGYKIKIIEWSKLPHSTVETRYLTPIKIKTP